MKHFYGLCDRSSDCKLYSRDWYKQKNFGKMLKLIDSKNNMFSEGFIVDDQVVCCNIDFVDRSFSLNTSR